jgi:E3 ubiquitin-protein ligase MYCBP2
LFSLQVYILSSKFGQPLTTDSFQALLSLLNWAWSTFKASVAELVDTPPSRAALMDLQRLVFICRASQRLLVSYVDTIYPSPASQSEKEAAGVGGGSGSGGGTGAGRSLAETQRLAECVFEVRTQLVSMLADPLPVLSSVRKSGQPANLRHQAIEMADLLLNDAHKTFVACFHAFYPTGPLKWVCLCSLLNSLDMQGNSSSSSGGSVGGGGGRLLSAAIDALCNPMIKLRSTFPIGIADAAVQQSGGSKADVNNSGGVGSPLVENSLSVTGSMLYLGEMTPSCKYPILSEVMNYQSQVEAVRFGSWTFPDVLGKLLNIVCLPVRQCLQNQKISHSGELVSKACRLIATVISELCNMKGGTEATLANMANRVPATTPTRFSRINSSRTWNTGNGSPDAICFSVDRAGLLISGAAVFGGLGSFDYELELLQDQSNREKDSNQRWISMEMCHGTYTGDECANDMFMIKFDKPVAINAHTKYALRLRNHGGGTCNGDGGQAEVRGPDGTTFTFTSCSLSFNGTNPTRGQIPQILYYASPAAEGGEPSISNTTVNIAQTLSHKSALSLTTTVARAVANLLSLAVKKDDGGAADGRAQEVLNSAPVITTLLPHVLASVAGLACSDPQAAVQVISLIRDLLPQVADLNNQSQRLAAANGFLGGSDYSPAADHHQLPSSPHYAWVESEHPYKAAGIANYRVVFPPSVKWMAIEFDPACCTAQPEDSLQLYIRNPASQRPKNLSSPLVTTTSGRSGSGGQVKSQRYSPVLSKLSGQRGWPAQSVVLPGNEVLFSLETASDYVKGEKAAHWGFKCLVAGYEVQDGGGQEQGLKSLEHELAYLGGLCAASLMNKAIQLPKHATSGTGVFFKS